MKLRQDITALSFNFIAIIFRKDIIGVQDLTTYNYVTKMMKTVIRNCNYY